MGSLSLGTNLIARNVQRATNVVTDNLRRVSERLASGQRINRASDDAAGLAVSTSLFAQSRIYTQALRNGNDAISALNIADSSLGEMNSVLIRMRELAVQSANGTLSAKQRQSVDREAQALAAEFQRMQSTTQFNGMQLLGNSQSSVGIQLGSGRYASMNINLGISGTGSYTSTPTGNQFSEIQSYRGLTGALTDFAVGDFDGDGKSDVVTVDDTSGEVKVALSDGTSFVNPTQVWAGISAIAGIATGDFNSDGMDDIVLGYTDGTVVTLHASGSGNMDFVDSATVAPSLSNVKPIIADMDQDGSLDIVFASGSSLVFLNNTGSGTFSSNIAATSASKNINQMAVGQFQGDAYKDIVTYSAGSTELFTGAGNDVSAKSSLALASAGAQTAGDMNGDGYDDLLAFSGAAVKLWNGNGSGGFTLGASLSIGFMVNPVGAVTGDFDGDGTQDIIVNDAYQSINFWQGNQDGSYSFVTGQLAPDSPDVFYLAKGDINGDGFTDAFAAGLGGFTQGVDAYVSVVDPGGVSTTTTILALEDFSLLNVTSARNALQTIDDAMEKISQTRGGVGASLSRLGSALNTLQAARENSEAAAGRIMDADIGFEAANYTRFSLLQQTGAALLAQANQIPALVLRLLGG